MLNVFQMGLHHSSRMVMVLLVVSEGESNAVVCEPQATNVTSSQEKWTLYNFVLVSMICWVEHETRLSFIHFIYFFTICVFFYEHSRFTGQQEKWEAVSLTPIYHFQSPYRHLDISQAITTGSSQRAHS